MGQPLVCDKGGTQNGPQKVYLNSYIHNEASKTVMWEDAATYEESYREWARNYTFARCRCLNNWIGHDDVFFQSGKPKMIKQYLMHWTKLVMPNL